MDTVYVVVYEQEVRAIYANKDTAIKHAHTLTWGKGGNNAYVEPWKVE